MRCRVIFLFILASLWLPLRSQDILISYGDMYRNSDGRIDYRLVATVPTWVWKPSLASIKLADPDLESGTWRIINLQQSLRVKHAYWVAPWGLFESRQMTLAQVLAAGVTQAEINQLESLSDQPVDRSRYPITFREESRMVSEAPVDLYPGIRTEDRKAGNLDLFATLPSDHPGGRWGFTMTSALGEERSYVLTLSPGMKQIRILGVEAGNCLVKLFALSAQGQATTYFQEVPVVVRKGQAGVARIELRPYKDPSQYQIASLALGQNSQVQGEGETPLPLQEGKDAMVRLLVADRYGAGGNGSLPVQVRLSLEGQGSVLWSTTLDTSADPRWVKTGRSTQAYNQAGPVIPGDRLMAGSILRATLVDKATGKTLQETSLTPSIIKPRRIIIHGYDVRPVYTECKWDWWLGYICYPAVGSGSPLARNESEMNNQVLPYVREVFPYSTVEYRYEGKLWIAMAARGLTFTGQVHLAMQERQGFHQTDANAAVEHIYLGMVNSSYGSVSTPGVAWYGYRAMAVTNCKDYQGMGYLIAHELGHTFRLEHAPSEGAYAAFLSWPYNRVDGNYAYGGAGLTGGWGFSKLGNWFLSEDAHTIYNRNPHWDLMSYSQGPAYWNTNLSDFFIRKYLIPSWANGTIQPMAAPMAPEGPLFSNLTPEQIQGTTTILGFQAANELSARIRALGFQPDPMTTPEIDWSKLDPSKGDSEDPAPPLMVFKAMPSVGTPAN